MVTKIEIIRKKIETAKKQIEEEYLEENDNSIQFWFGRRWRKSISYQSNFSHTYMEELYIFELCGFKAYILVDYSTGLVAILGDDEK